VKTKKYNRVLGLVLTMCMVLSMIPFTAMTANAMESSDVIQKSNYNDICKNGGVDGADLHIYDNNGFCSCGAYEPAKYGPGTEEYEKGDYFFEIENAGQLFWFAQNWNNGTIDQYAENGFYAVKLVNDIELNPDYVFNSDGTFTGGESPREWTPIMNFDLKHFLGQNHTISGLYINQPETDYVGLFGAKNGYIIKELTLTNGYVSGKEYVGSILGYGEGVGIERCISDVTIVAVTGSYVGGIAGCIDGGYVDECINKGNVTGLKYHSGILGGENGFVYNSYNIGTISVRGNAITGADYKNCYFLDIYDFDDGGKTAEQFASGEVAYLLNANDDREEDEWFQTCGEGTPSFSGETVYQVDKYSCDTSVEPIKAYSNTNEAIYDDHIYSNACDKTCDVCGNVREVPDHVYEDGICTGCGAWKFDLGDVNCDGEVVINDATLVQKYLAHIEFLTDVQKNLADVNGDGIISIRDATYIQMYAVKMIEEFPFPKEETNQ